MKIDHLNIVCADLEKSAAWYEGLFGFRRGFSATLEGEWIGTVTGLSGAFAKCLFLEPPGGGARLELIQYLAPTGEAFRANSLPNTFGLRHFAVEVPDMGELLAKLEALGVTPISPPVAVPFLVANLGRKHLLYFQDPDGTLVEAAAYEVAS